jgi:hypothetical protein
MRIQKATGFLLMDPKLEQRQLHRLFCFGYWANQTPTATTTTARPSCFMVTPLICVPSKTITSSSSSAWLKICLVDAIVSICRTAADVLSCFPFDVVRTSCNASACVCDGGYLDANNACEDAAPPCNSTTEYEIQALTYSTNRVCSPLTDCLDTEFESRAPDPTTDRVCTNATACTTTQYETFAPTASSDRQCADITPCTLTQFESAAATATSDRTCQDLTTCSNSQWEAVLPTFTNDRVCKNWIVCTATQFATRAPTTTNDRVCQDLTNCTDREYQTVAPTSSTDRVCAPLTVCTPLQYEAVKPSFSSDRFCAGKFDERFRISSGR